MKAVTYDIEAAEAGAMSGTRLSNEVKDANDADVMGDICRLGGCSLYVYDYSVEPTRGYRPIAVVN